MVFLETCWTRSNAHIFMIFFSETKQEIRENPWLWERESLDRPFRLKYCVILHLMLGNLKERNNIYLKLVDNRRKPETILESWTDRGSVRIVGGGTIRRNAFVRTRFIAREAAKERKNSADGVLHLSQGSVVSLMNTESSSPQQQLLRRRHNSFVCGLGGRWPRGCSSAWYIPDQRHSFPQIASSCLGFCRLRASSMMTDHNDSFYVDRRILERIKGRRREGGRVEWIRGESGPKRRVPVAVCLVFAVESDNGGAIVDCRTVSVRSACRCRSTSRGHYVSF